VVAASLDVDSVSASDIDLPLEESVSLAGDGVSGGAEVGVEGGVGTEGVGTEGREVRLELQPTRAKMATKAKLKATRLDLIFLS
jgi:hypothetical protein